MSEITADQIMEKLSRRWKPTARLTKLLRTDSGRLRRRLKNLEKEGLVEARKRKGQLEWRLVKGEATRIRQIKKEPKTFKEEQKTPEQIKSDMQGVGLTIYKTLAKGQFPEIDLPSRSTGNIRFDQELGQYVLADKTVTRSTRNVGQIRSFSQFVWVMRFLKELLSERKSSTLRDIYYQSFGFGVKFAQQSESDTTITDVEAKLKTPRESFRVFPEDRAAMYGDLTIEYTAPQKYAGRQVNLTDHPDGLMIGPYLTSAKLIKCKAKKVIAIECLSPTTIVQLADGNIISLNNVEPSQIVAANFDKYQVEPAEAIAVSSRPRDQGEEVYNIKTGGMAIEATRLHQFFVLTEKGICSKRVKDIKEGDWIAEARRIRVNTKPQQLPPIEVKVLSRINAEGRTVLLNERKKQGLSQFALTKRIGISQTTLSRIERGVQNPKKTTLVDILQVLGINPDEFLENFVTSYSSSKPIRIPTSLSSDVAQLLGYLLGDGYVEYSSHHYWVQFTDRNTEILKHYQKMVKQIFRLKGKIVEKERNRLTIYSAPLARYFKNHFSELIRKSPERDISTSILRSPLETTNAFLRGLFDAEGYVITHSVEIQMSSPHVIRKIQLLLLRHNIISHLTKYPTHKTKNLMYKLQITDRESLRLFEKHISFNHPLKRQKLETLCKHLKDKPRRPNRPQFPPIVRQLIRHKFRKQGLSIPPKFYGNTRGISRELVEEAISHLGNEQDLQKLLNGDIMWSKVRKIRILENPPHEVWDLTVPGPANFIANGIITHNSGGMFTRFVEDGVHENHNALLIHTGGQAPRSVRRIIRRLRYELNLPTYLFVDADPWGAHIAMVIISGSASAAHLRGLATPDAVWMGVWASDIQKYNLPSDPFTDTDKKRTQDLLKDPRYQSKFWQKELKLFLKTGRKAEQQAFSRYGLSFVTEEYLPKKFEEITKLQRQGVL